MGYAEFIIVMESRIGSVSSGLGSFPGMRGQTLKSSPFCPRSASKLTQSIIKDHMVSHYKKVYSAKAAIDTSVPKSLIHSVKYNDQIRKDLARKGGRPQSAHSFSQRNTRASCSSAQSRLSVQYDDSPYLCSTNSVVSSTGLSTSFHVKDIVYPSCKVTQNHSHHARPASQIQYRNPEAVLQRKQSVCSLAPSGDQSCYKIFQDPVQKTYSGDLLQKHSQRFTPDKPFTPKTLKSDKSSYLSKYRYYRAPQKKPTQDRTHMRSTNRKECTQEFEDPFQGFNKEPDWSENEFNDTYFSPSRQRSQANKSRDHYLFDSSSREEELMYLEFISAVTEDMLSRGHISDRVLDRVIMRHIDMNRHQLDEGKMRHLLEVLRKDFEEPISISNSSTEPENKEDDLFDTLLPHLESVEKQIPQTKEDNDIFPYASLIKYDSPGYTDAISGFTPLSSPKRAASLMTTEEKNEEGDIQEKCTGSPWFHENLTNNTGIIEEDSHQNQTGLTITSIEVSSEHHEKTTETSDEGFQQDQVEASYERQSTELEDLGRSLSVSLHVSNNTNCKNMETASEQHTNTVASVSDDEF
ncbi:spermatogenesis-associated protein 7 homolog isoform X2 [Mastacembelus armatus]|uniref:spermatogenesis-associated protein 7 homolog isoform X2 n=1 Tax=Mastacembelus armatus TaxID=205130 RepID=UPI000E4544F4|nr:spermatogenesis-associated protein 7 isoform X2 [Mastacembelus armatus]